MLLSPYDPTGSFYYSRRLKSHNLTVTEIDNMTTYAYLWSEQEAAKGSCEVSTGVLKFLQEKKKEGKEYINPFCDRCGGQNQNRMMLSEALHSLKLKKIELKFLVPGHSQNENDTAHSTIEGQYKNRTIYTPNQLEMCIQQSFKSNVCHVTVKS